MIKMSALCFFIGCVSGCSPSQFSKEQEVYTEVARYACYHAAGIKAAEALETACPDFAKKVEPTLSCPITDQIIAVLESDLAACDSE